MLSISFIVIKPFSLFPSTIGSFSILCSRRIDFASSRVVPTGAVTRFSFVIISVTFTDKSSLYFKSLFVIIPFKLPSLSTIGNPEILYSFIRLFASCNIASSLKVIGLVIIPLSYLFTF